MKRNQKATMLWNQVVLEEAKESWDHTKHGAVEIDDAYGHYVVKP